MKYLLIILIGITVTCCTRDYSCIKPNHIGLSTGVDFEIQKGCNLKTNHSVNGCLDWNL